ncbi:hypothetical protein [Roseovarius pacificus]|uniref:hypothetical protein n=1 Tax=Roseovarius pacificus TaxID=337701 RepID=UPI002A18957F|nr:hypothetical protein [Roseovarius pacificus]
MAQAFPPTTQVLGLAPEDTMISLAIPAAARLETQLRQFAGRMLPQEANVTAMHAALCRRLADFLGLPPADDIAQAFHAAGLDPDAPSALFADLTPMREAVEEARAIAMGSNPWLHRTDPDTPRKALAHLAVVTGCLDSAAFVRWVEQLAAQRTRGAPQTDSQGIITCGGMAFAHKDSYAFMANDAAWLQACLDRVDAPVLPRYGTAACPPLSPGEMVMLTRLDLLWNLFPLLEPVLEYQIEGVLDDYEPLARMLRGEQALFTSPDPCVTTLALEEGEISLTSRVDRTKHHAFAEYMKSVPAGQLAEYLPEDASALVIVGWPDPLRDYLLGEFPFAAPLEYVSEEIQAAALCMQRSTQEMPQFTGIIQTRTPQAAEEFLKDAGMLTPAEDLPGAPEAGCYTINGAPIPLYLAAWDTFAVVSTGRTGLEAAVQRVRGGATTDVLARQDPPVNSALNTVMLVSGNAAALKTLLALSGLPEDSMPGMVLGAIQSVQAGKVSKGDWDTAYIRVRISEDARP